MKSKLLAALFIFHIAATLGYARVSGESPWTSPLSNVCHALFGRQYGLLYAINPFTPAWQKQVVKLLKNDRYQEAVWKLREVGEHSKADELEKDIIEVLRNAEIEIIGTLKLGGSKPTLVKLSDGMFAVFKKNNKETYGDVWLEEASYLLSKTLGLDLVPITVMREFNGIRGSLQAFVHGQHRKGRGELPLSTKGKFFRFLNANFDWKGANVLYLEHDREVLIDNSKAFLYDKDFETMDMLTYKAKFSDLVAEVTEINPGADVLNRLASYSEAQWTQLFMPRMDPRMVEQFLERRNFLLKFFKSSLSNSR